MTFDSDAVAELQEVLGKTKSARADAWEWAQRIADSFEFSARRDFEGIVLTDVERAVDAPVELAYRDLRRLQNRLGVKSLRAVAQIMLANAIA